MGEFIMGTNGDDGHSRKSTTLKHFYDICEALRGNKDWFLSNRPTYDQAVRKMEEITGINGVSKSTIRNARKATGISWLSKYDRRNGNSSGSGRSRNISHDVRTVARCVRSLFRDLGVDVPRSLQEVCDRLKGERTGGSSQEPFPEHDEPTV